MRPVVVGFVRILFISLLLLALRAPAQTLDTLRPGHPRLMLTDDRLEALKERAMSDAVLQKFIENVRAQADKLLDAKPLEHVLVGPRLLTISRTCLDRVYTLALAWRWFGDERYAKAAEANLLTVCAFPDWNPSHFLDTAEMSHAVGVGYDWLYPWLRTESREAIRKALVEIGLKPGIKVYEGGKGWTISDFNWNQVCNGGMIVGALAVAESDPALAEFIVPKAVASLPLALASYGPDGAWMEGPSYWGYATRYTAYGICALDTALGTDFGVSESPGLRNAGHFPNYTAGPTGLYLNYADSGERGRRKVLPCMFWLAEKYQDYTISDAEHLVVKEFEAAPEHVVWYVPPTGKEATPMALDKHFGGKVDVVVMRSAWNDPNALFVGVKGGYNQVNHGHLDLGNFEMDALGVRWVRDLGSDDYNLPGYWDKKPGGKRWQYYRLNSESHSVPMLNAKSQDESAVAKLLDFATAEDHASASFDLSGAYPDATAVRREVSLVDGRRMVRVRDSFTLDTLSDLTWGITTDAEIAINDNGTATLTLDGRTLTARINAPEGALFSVVSAERDTPEKKNAGVRRLCLEWHGITGDVVVDVTLEPVWPK